MKILLALILTLPAVAAATDIEATIRTVAISKKTITTTINGSHAEVVYVGSQATCESVSIRWTQDRIENFRVCSGDVNARGTVSPSWGDDSENPVIFKAVVNSAIMYGQAEQTDRNGYLVSARALKAVSSDCVNIEVIVSYDYDLVDHVVREICGRNNSNY
jgi:hypothetical protein